MNVVLNHAESGFRAGEYTFTDTDFQVIATLANREFGLFLQASKKSLVYSRLARRLRALHLESFRQYCDLLQAPAGREELPHLLSALTTNVTHFFREKHHFDQLREEILPPIMARAKEGASIRIWSAACSAGQEAYCMAATVLDVCPDAHRLDVKILATDIDPVVLETAKAGRYPMDQLGAIELTSRGNMIDANETDENMFSIRGKTRALVTFATLNLVDAWPMRRPFDVIMCRNAAIYFDKATQARLWSRFAGALTSDGFLMIGHSERLSGEAASRFRSIGVTAYQRTS